MAPFCILSKVIMTCTLLILNYRMSLYISRDSMKGEYTFYYDTFEFDECLLQISTKHWILVVNIFTKPNNIYTKRFQWHVNTYVGQQLKQKCTSIVLFTHFYLFNVIVKKGGGSALNIFSIFCTHHRIPNEHI
jgi:hypothetical protein